MIGLTLCRRMVILSFFVLDASCEMPAITMSSRYNDNDGYLAVDGNHSTCAETGTEIGPWWKIDLNHSRIVTQVGVQGGAAAFQIRVGNETTDVGDCSGFANNPLCVFSNGITSDNLVYFRCRRPRYGRYLSIHLVDPAWPGMLRLCQVVIQ